MVSIYIKTTPHNETETSEGCANGEEVVERLGLRLLKQRLSGRCCFAMWHNGTAESLEILDLDDLILARFRNSDHRLPTKSSVICWQATLSSD